MASDSAYQYNPSDRYLIKSILKTKMMGEEFPLESQGLFLPVDIYGTEAPWVIFSNNNYPSRNSNFFGFSKIKQLNGKTKRTAGKGVWKAQWGRKVKEVNGQVIGFLGVYSFRVNKKATHWIMYEYSLAPSKKLKEGDSVLFKIFFNPNARGAHDMHQQPPSSSSSNWQTRDEDMFNIDNASISMPALLLAKDSLEDPCLFGTGRDTSNRGCSDDI